MTRPPPRPAALAGSLLLAGALLLGWVWAADRMEWAVPANMLLSAGIVARLGVGRPDEK